jgi:hypothetical protein
MIPSSEPLRTKQSVNQVNEQTDRYDSRDYEIHGISYSLSQALVKAQQTIKNTQATAT